MVETYAVCSNDDDGRDVMLKNWRKGKTNASVRIVDS